MIKVILDTNVFVAGIVWAGPPYEILQKWKNDGFKLVFTEAILDEYMRVGDKLASRYHVDIKPFIELVTVHGELHLSKELPFQVTNDPDDEKFIAAALVSGCRCIVSGDKHLLNVSGYNGIQVLKPRAFLESLERL